MKIRDFFSFNTLEISFPVYKTILAALLLLPLFLLTIEFLLRLFPIPESVLIPSFDREINYPEIDIKFSRLAAVERTKKINCFLLGNSMVDVGLDPLILNSQSDLLGVENPACFNMGMSAMMPETSTVLADILNKRFNPSLMFLGVSPLDFTGKDFLTRKFNRSPWFLYQEGNSSSEGWLIDNSSTYRYWLAFNKYRNPAYRGELENQLLLIEPFGLQVRQKARGIFEVNPIQHLTEYQISQNDLNGLINFTKLDSSTLKVVVIEMPIHPDFLSYYVPGGEEGYEKYFIQPVQKVLDEHGILFVRTQPFIKSIVTPDGWRDQFHLSRKGADQLSQWLVANINQFTQ